VPRLVSCALPAIHAPRVTADCFEIPAPGQCLDAERGVCSPVPPVAPRVVLSTGPAEWTAGAGRPGTGSPGCDAHAWGMRAFGNRRIMSAMRLAPRALALALVLGGLGASAVSADEAGKTYGDGVTLKRPVPVAALLEKPEAHTGKAVRVDGVVSQVCQSMGCWIEITDPALGRGIRFKARDGVIVFPKDASGRKVSAQGVFEQIATSDVRESHAASDRAAENSGKPTPGTPTEKIYWVRVSGAVLY
jgi:hypothetical protein